MVVFFGYNNGMNWARKAFVGFLAFLLLVCLVGGVAAYNAKNQLSHPDKIETWLADSGIYSHVVPALLSQAQEDAGQNGTSISVSFNDPSVQAAAKSAFTDDILRTSTNKFIDSNYDWLSGKTTKPEFTIDLTQAKQSFADKVGEYVRQHLASLPACTPDQLAKLQIPVDPSTVTCRPGSLDPATEGKRVADEVANNSDFLGKPMVTADTLNHDANSSSQPYYQKLKNLPKAYQNSQKLAGLLALIAIICAAGIVFIHPDRRRGIRRVGTTFTVAGVLLIATKLVSDSFTSRLQDSVLTSGTKSQLNGPFTKFLHTVESQLTQSNMLFGIIFIAIGLAILIYLFATRDSRERKQKPRQVNTPDQPVKKPALSSPENRPQPPVQANLPDRMRAPRPTGPPPLGGTPRPNPHSTSSQSPQRPRPPKPPRLIQ
jgi:hypothetical protein